MANLWGNAAMTPVGDAARYELGTVLEVLPGAQILVSAIRAWSPPGSQVVDGPRVGRIWSNGSGAVLATLAMPAELTDGWAAYPLDEPLVLDPGVYTIAVSIQNGYGTSPAPGATVSADGLVTAPDFPSRYTVGVGTRPTLLAGSSLHYGIDIEWEPAASDDAVITASVTTSVNQATLTYSADLDVDWAIDWGDGQASTGPGPKTHTYATPGPHAILVQAKTPTGAESSKAIVATTILPPGSLAYDIPVAVSASDVVQDFVVAQIDDVSDANIGSRIPSAGLSGRLPFVRVNHWNGESDRFATRPVVDLDVFAATYADAGRIARAIEAKLLGYPFRVSSGGRSVLVDSVQVLTETTEVEWQQDSTIRRFQGTYQFSIRR